MLPRKRSVATPSPPPLTKRKRSSPTAGTGSNDGDQTNFRIFSWNVNGIEPLLPRQQRPITASLQPHPRPATRQNLSSSSTSASSVPTSPLREFLRRHDWPHLLFLQEVKIKSSDTSTRHAVEKAVSRSDDHCFEPDYRAFFTLPSDKHNARGFGGKLYGVCSIVRCDFYNDHEVKVRTVDWDSEGRVQVIETSPRTTPAPPLSIFNLYAVNGTDAPYRNSETGVVEGTRHQRKLAFHRLLLAECLHLQAQGREVILAGDLNVACSVLDGFPHLRTSPHQHVLNRADFNAKFLDETNDDGLQAVDTFRHVHGDARGYTYHPRNVPFESSCDRVDMILCSKRLAGNISDAGILETPAHRGPSDHCPLYAEFSFG